MGLRQCFPGDGNTSKEIHRICPQENTSDEEKQWSFGSSRLTKYECPAEINECIYDYASLWEKINNFCKHISIYVLTRCQGKPAKTYFFSFFHFPEI